MSVHVERPKSRNSSGLMRLHQHCFANQVGDLVDWHDDIDWFLCRKPIVSDLVDVTDEPRASAADQFYVVHPRQKDVGGSFLSSTHYFPRIGQFYTSLNEANHHAGPTTSNQSQNCCNQTQLVPQHGKKSTNDNFGPTHNQHNTNVNPLSASTLPAFRSPELPPSAPGTPIIGAA